MRKVLLCLALFTISLGAGTTKVFAAESNDPIGESPAATSLEETINTLFADSEAGDKVLEVEGGYLTGQMTTEDEKGNPIEYNSETDPRSITVEEAKKTELRKAKARTANGGADNPLLSARFLRPPHKPMYIAPGYNYKSGPWGGRGWQFAGHLFRNRSGRPNMTWVSIGDSGRVGDILDMDRLYRRGIVGGILLNSRVPRSVHATDGKGWLSYYSYNPRSGSYYQVFGQ